MWFTIAVLYVVGFILFYVNAGEGEMVDEEIKELKSRVAILEGDRDAKDVDGSGGCGCGPVCSCEDAE